MNGSGSTGRDVFWWIALFQTPERSARPSGVRGTGVPFGFGISVSTGDAGGWASTGTTTENAKAIATTRATLASSLGMVPPGLN